MDVRDVSFQSEIWVDQLRAMSTGVGSVLVALYVHFRYRIDTEQLLVAYGEGLPSLEFLSLVVRLSLCIPIYKHDESEHFQSWQEIQETSVIQREIYVPYQRYFACNLIMLVVRSILSPAKLFWLQNRRRCSYVHDTDISHLFILLPSEQCFRLNNKVYLFFLFQMFPRYPLCALGEWK